MRRIPYIPHKVKEKVSDLIEKNFAEYSDSPYNAPLVPVVQKNGDVRLCFDYRKLNEKTTPSKFSIPRPDVIFSVLSLKNGYYHMAIRPEDRLETAFSLPWYKLQLIRMAQGLPVPRLHLQKVL